MKSRKKKSNKSHILFAFGKGIAAARAIEAAMLFSHAGFDIHPIFLDEAENWVSSETVKTICGHSIASCNNNLFKPPKWFVPTWQGYELSLVFEPDENDIYSFVNSINLNKTHEHILDLSPKIFLCCSKEKIVKQNNNKIIFKALPENLCILSSYFQNLFAESIQFINKHIYPYRYSIVSLNNKEAESLSLALRNNGLIETNETSSDLLIDFTSENEATIKLNNNQTIYIKIVEKGIIVKNNINLRLFPNISIQPAYQRLVDYLLIELTRKNNI